MPTRAAISAALLLALAGCGQTGTILVWRGAAPASAEFGFSLRGAPGLHTTGLDVYAREGGKRRENVCHVQAKTSSANRRAPLVARWTYGAEPTEGHYWMAPCAPLRPGQAYEVVVTRDDHRLDKLPFHVAADGDVEAGP